MARIFPLKMFIALAVLAGITGAADPQDIEFFEKQVRPLLVKRCYECHSAEAKEIKGGLALDSKTGWEVGGDSGPAIMPGQPDESLLISAVRYDSFEMPPQGKMPAAEIAILEKWVRLGAPDPRIGDPAAKNNHTVGTVDWDEARQFWAFQLPEAHRPPPVQNTGWPTDDIDRFVLAKLEAAGLAPAPDAEPETWLRRVTFDLTGLPPTAAELDTFLADRSPSAREAVVDRLLASKQYGVHWGRHWLDVARYADSNGSDFNATFFNAWRYRNYVIDAFNADKPYDEFIREQLAGDLLPYSSDEQRKRQLVATTFLNIGPKMLSERDKAKLVMDVVDEQVDSVGKAFLGLTLGCARCHDHKFDPLPTADYYAMAGILKSTITLEGESQQYVSAWVETPLPIAAEHAAALEKHQAKTARLKSQLAESKKVLQTAEQQLAALDSSHTGIVVDDKDAKIVGPWKDSTFSPRFVGKGYIHDEKSGQGTKSITWTPKLPRSGRYEVRLAFAGSSGRDAAVPVTIRHADGVTQLKVDQSKPAKIDQLFEPLGTFRFNAGSQGSVSLSNTGTTGYVIADAVQFLPVKSGGDAAIAERPPGQKEIAARTAVEVAKQQIQQLEAALASHEKAAPPPVPTAMAAREAPQIGDCEICIRGEVSNRGAIIERGFLQVLSSEPRQIENKSQSGRVELAEWIARPDNPLTARVIVNRVWQHLLGEGLVRSVDNFGHLGQRPTHPELLDTLAVEFVENGWSVKELVRHIALSRAYAQSSRFDADAYERDPENKLLWRANRKRVIAESLRDAMLAASGELDLTPGQSPVAGYGYLVVNNASQDSSGKKVESKKRSVYLPIIRNELPEFLVTFDFADPDVVTGRRSETNVPGQALFLLNDPFVKERAAATAERLAEIETETERIREAYRLILSRPPNLEEHERALEFIASCRGDGWRQFVQALFASTEFRMLD